MKDPDSLLLLFNMGYGRNSAKDRATYELYYFQTHLFDHPDKKVFRGLLFFETNFRDNFLIVHLYFKSQGYTLGIQFLVVVGVKLISVSKLFISIFKFFDF